VTISFGGSNLAGSISAGARIANLIGTIATHNASRSAKLGSVVLREREWGLQNDLAAADIEHLDQQIIAAQIALDIQNLKKENQQKQIGFLQEVVDFMQNKFTKADLYEWLRSELFSQYTVAFDITYDLAKRAEQGYRFKRGVADSNFIQPTGYWENAYQGLLAGERLLLALRQMEQAYEQQNFREFELTKTISLLQLDPLQLIRLKETGRCEFELPEALFDLDYPGHYMRRIQSVALTIPCVVGPYTGVNATLRLTDNAIRWQPTLVPQYSRTGDNDPRFYVSHTPTQAIATSTGQNDSGLFEVNPRDERYLPFEGAGALSRWTLEMGSVVPQIDTETFTDVLLTVRLTAREDGRLKQAAIDSLKAALKSATGMPTLHGPADTPKPLARLFSLRHEFPTEWQTLMGAPLATEPDPVVRSINLPIVQSRFPFYLQRAALQPLSVLLVAVAKDSATLAAFSAALQTSPAAADSLDIDLKSNPLVFGSALAGATADGAALDAVGSDEAKPWGLGLKMNKATFEKLSESLRDLLMVVSYTATLPN
jgi:hypothetical protein